MCYIGLARGRCVPPSNPRRHPALSCRRIGHVAPRRRCARSHEEARPSHRRDRVGRRRRGAPPRREGRNPRLRQLSPPSPPAASGTQSEDRRPRGRGIEASRLLQARQGAEGVDQPGPVAARVRVAGFEPFGRANAKQPEFAAPACDWDDALLSRPGSHRASHVAAPERPVVAGRIAPSGKNGPDPVAPPVVPGATSRKPAVLRRNGCSRITPIAEVAPGKSFPPGSGNRARHGFPAGAYHRRMASRDDARITAAPGRPRGRRDTPPNRS